MVATLILLNGAPGSGKSTLARRYAGDHPLTLNLDIDRIRDLLGCWQQTPGPAGLAARAIALAAARTHLAAGHDVIVPQLLADRGFLRQLDELADEAGVAFAELLLSDTPANTRRRFLARTDGARGPVDPAHLEAARQLDLSGGLEQLDRYHARLTELAPDRPNLRIVPSRDGEIEQTYAAVLAEIRAVCGSDVEKNREASK